jgi:hypothetical protein
MSVPVSFRLAKIAPAIPKLLMKNPQLSLDIRFEDAVIDLLGDAVDLAIRCGFPPPDSPFVVSRRLASFERILCASPSFLKRAGTPTNVEDLADTRCVIVGAGATRWHFETLAGPREVVVEGRLRTSTVLAMREAALAGLGVAQMPEWLVADDLRIASPRPRAGGSHTAHGERPRSRSHIRTQLQPPSFAAGLLGLGAANARTNARVEEAAALRYSQGPGGLATRRIRLRCAACFDRSTSASARGYGLDACGSWSRAPAVPTATGRGIYSRLI